MVEVSETASINADADTIWRDIGAFGAVGNWHPMLDGVETDGEAPGSLRIAHSEQGDQHERLIAVDPTGRNYRYRIEQSPMPVEDYEAEFRVNVVDDQISEIVWTARFDVPSSEEAETTQMVRGFFQAGLSALEKQYG